MKVFQIVVCVIALFLFSNIAVGQECPGGQCPQSISVTQWVPMVTEYAPVRSTIVAAKAVAVQPVASAKKAWRSVKYETRTVFEPRTYVRRTVTRRGLWWRAR